jgi:putative transposase
MSTYTQILYQIVFSTKKREKTLKKENRTELYQYIWGILRNKKCHLYRINGVEDHLHIIMHLHPTIALSSLIKDIKVASSGHIKEKGLFPDFQGWQEGYGAFTYSIGAKDALIEYVKNQEAHHAQFSYQDELRGLLEEHGVEFDEKYFE